MIIASLLCVPALHHHHDHAHRDQHHALLIMIIVINAMSISFINRSTMPVLLCRVCCCCRLQLDYDPIMTSWRLTQPIGKWLPNETTASDCMHVVHFKTVNEEEIVFETFPSLQMFSISVPWLNKMGTGFQIYCLGLNIQKTNNRTASNFCALQLLLSIIAYIIIIIEKVVEIS